MNNGGEVQHCAWLGVLTSIAKGAVLLLVSSLQVTQSHSLSWVGSDSCSTVP